MSKLVTIVLALDLAEDGFIGLTDEVSDYLPEVATLKVARAIWGNQLNLLNFTLKVYFI